MNREQLYEGILDLADSPHMRQFALEHAMDILTSEELGRLFDQVADHHELLHPIVDGRRRERRSRTPPGAGTRTTTETPPTLQP